MPDERVDLAQRQGRRGPAVEVAPEEAVGGHAELERGVGGLFGDGGTVLPGEGEDAEDATDAGGAVVTVDVVADGGDGGAGPLGGGEQGEGLRRGAGGPVSVLDAMPAPRRAQVLAEELAGAGIEQPHVSCVPLDVDATADPARRRPVVGRRNLDAAVQMHGAVAVLVVAERLEPDMPPHPSPFQVVDRPLAVPPNTEQLASTHVRRSAETPGARTSTACSFMAAGMCAGGDVQILADRAKPQRRRHAPAKPRTGPLAEVDYGEGPMVHDPASGKYRRTRLFVLTLGYSRKAVRLLVHRSSAQIWAELHERAFRRLGGTVRVVVLDNLKEGVLTPDIYDPTLNPLYRDVLAHYGVVALPCRVRDPDRKGKVEAAVGHAQKTPLRGLRFERLDDGQAYLDRWEQRWADTRVHGTTKRQVAAMFAEERPALGPLPLEPFRYYQYGHRTVHLDGCVEVASAYYGAPPGWIGRSVHVQWNAAHVRLLDPRTGQLLREHLRAPRGWHRIEDRDRPARTPPKTLALLAAAKRAGPAISTICDHIHRHDGAAGVRRILGVLSLARKHGPAVAEEAANAALELGVPTYRFLRRYLDRRPAAPLSLRQVDPLIRQLTLYRDLIDRRTGDPS